MPWS
ncbi:hypothetical protein TIFTF001_054260 [Ficus carica]|jgi:hypothetical protein